jgi:hypothetical protein
MSNSIHNSISKAGGDNTYPVNRKEFYQVILTLNSMIDCKAISKPFESFIQALTFYEQNITRDCDLNCEWCEDPCTIEYFISCYVRQADGTNLWIRDFFIERLEQSDVMTSHGEIIINKNTGMVIENNTEYKDIDRFAIEEYCLYWNEKLADCYDILDLGAWDKNGNYTAADEDFRADYKAQTA